MPIARQVDGHTLHVPDLGLPGRYAQAWCSCGWRSDSVLAYHWALKQAHAHFDAVRGML